VGLVWGSILSLQHFVERGVADDIGREHWFAFNILPHETSLRRWLAGLRIQDSDALDIVQESYALLLERDRLDDILNPRAYLFQVAHSLMLRNIRRARIVPILAIEELGTIEVADKGATPEQKAIGLDDLRHLSELIEGMPEQARQAFVFRRIHALSQREIAERMGISENTVEKHIARGIRWLGDRLADGGNPCSHISKGDGRKNKRV
jgi:RNA polymerase sigma factor (sigma-70 family)